jgi:hypothetical protein
MVQSNYVCYLDNGINIGLGEDTFSSSTLNVETKDLQQRVAYPGPVKPEDCLFRITLAVSFWQRVGSRYWTMNSGHGEGRKEVAQETTYGECLGDDKSELRELNGETG